MTASVVVDTTTRVVTSDSDEVVVNLESTVLEIENPSFEVEVGVPGPQGPPGEAGAPGVSGPPGPQGATGSPGPQGPVGPAGATGPQGATGPKGDTGADSTVPGPQGPTGPAGPTGPKGDTGNAGAAGATGPAGATGATGPPGPQGDPGPQGEPGPMGATGQSAGRIFYFWPSDDSDIAGYKTLGESPGAGAEVSIPRVCTGTGDFIVDEFVTEPGVPGEVPWPAGTVFRRIFASVSSGSGRIHVEVYKRNAAGVESLVRSESSPAFSATTPTLQDWTVTLPYPGIAMTATDRLVCKVYAQRVSGPASITVTTYFEGIYGSHIQTTISSGAQGEQGPPGPAGADGAPGPAGADGAPGEDGEVLIVSLTQAAYAALDPKDPDTLYVITDGADRTLLTGTGAPTAGDGIDGDFWINTTSWLIYGPKAGTWPSGVSLVGPTGATGPTGPGSDGSTTTQTGTVSTTNATQTPIVTVPIPASTSVMIEAKVVGRRTGGSAGVAEDLASFIRVYAFKNVAGVATVVGSAGSVFTGESQAGTDCVMVASGSNVEVRVIGIANTNINWKAVVKTYEVS